LGDQLNWEQFLEAVRGNNRVWIVTRDGDYVERIDTDRLILNPFLTDDLKRSGVKDVRVFDNLAKAIADIKAAGLSATKAPSDERLSQLSNALRPTFPTYEQSFPGPPTVCPSCKRENSFTASAPHPSRFGGWSFQATCRSCGFKWDVGEPYDD
jgi:hypothetical protein